MLYLLCIGPYYTIYLHFILKTTLHAHLILIQYITQKYNYKF